VPVSVASFANSSRPYITVNIQGADGQFHPIRGILDSGNDVTLLTPGASSELGLSRSMASGNFNVKGIGAKPMVFYNVNLLVQIKGTRPVRIRAGAQIPSAGEDQLRDNLFGRKDILDNFDILFSKGKIELHQHTAAGNTLPLGIPRAPHGDAWKPVVDDNECPFSNC
jgi:hypothetical protein